MKNLKVLLFVLCAQVAIAQTGVRWDLGGPIAGVSTTLSGPMPGAPIAGTITNFLVVAGPAQLNWCAYPANSVQGTPCTNYAPTYTDLTETSICPTNTPIVLQQTNICVGTSDIFGNLGVNTNAGTYTYTLTIGKVTYGPFIVTIGGGGAGGASTFNSQIVSFASALNGPQTVSLATSFTTTSLLTQCWDSNNPANQITPGNVSINPLTFVVTFTFAEPQSGYCVVSGAGSGGGGGGGGGGGPLPGVFSATPSTTNFGNVALGSTSPPSIVSLTNNSASTVSSIVINAPTGTNAADFSVVPGASDTCGSSLLINTNCLFHVTFTPTVNGPESASISVTDTASGSPQVVGLSGSGFTSNTASVSPMTLNFGSLPVGSSSGFNPVTITNNGNALITFTSTPTITGTNAGDFTFSSNCPGSLGQLRSCTISLIFAPAAMGARSATLNIFDTATGSPQSVSLSGTGTSTTTWTSLTPTGSAVSIPNTEQMQAVIAPSTGTAVPATANANWIVSGGGSGSPWACVTGPSASCTHNVAGYLTAFNTTLSKALPAETNTIHNLIIVNIFCFLSGNCTAPTVTDTNSNSYTCSAFAADTVNDGISECYTLNNATASNTITCAATGAGAYMACGAVEWSGNATSSVIDGTPVSGFGTAATMVTASLTTAGAYDALHAACFDGRYSGGAMTAATNFTIGFQQASAGATMMAERQFGVPADSYTGGGSDPSASPHWVCMLSAYKGTGTTTYASITQNGGLLTALSAGTAAVAAQGGRMVQKNSGASATSTNTITVPFNAAQTSGNTNVVAVGWTGTSGSVTSVNDTAGNTYSAACTAEQANGESLQFWMASPIVPFSGVNGNSVIVTMNTSVSGLSSIIGEIFGTAASSVQDGSCVSSTGASGPAAGTLTTSNATDTVIAAINPAQTVSATSAPFTIEATTSSGDALLDTPAFSATSYASSSTLSGGGYVEQMLALKVLTGSVNVTVGSQTVSNVYYISPSNGSPVGNDSNPGTLNAPFLTFTKAFATLLANCPGATGCTLYLEGNTSFGPGFVYQPATGTGFPNMNCGAGGNVPNGTATAPMTITALNERTAWIKGDGTAQPFVMSNCAYWTVNGLHVSSTNTPSTVYGESGIMYFTNTSHLTATRNLLEHTNQCQNAHGMALNYTNTNFLVQENELYYFHRHGFIAYGGSNNGVFRRNYANYRNYGENACYTGGIPPGIPPVGAGVTDYGSSNIETDDNIVEGAKAIDEEPVTGGPYNTTNSHYGDVSLNSAGFGFGGAAHDTGASSPPTSISFVNPVVINAAVVPAYMRCMSGTTWTNGSIFNSLATAPTDLYQQDNNGGSANGACPVSFNPTSTISHSEIYSSSPVTVTGYNIANGSSTISNSGAFNSPTISTATVTSPFTSNPGYGSCYLWAPDSSAAQIAGVGATILYTTVGGTVTANPIWATQGTMSATYRGAVIVGSVNDPGTWPGLTLTDIGPRLHIGSVNGCAFPASYTPAAQ